MLDYIERLNKHESKLHGVKLALVTAGILKPFDAFPELRPPDDDEEEGLPDDTEPVTYVFTGEESPESIEDELRTILASSAQGSATFDPDDWA